MERQERDAKNRVDTDSDGGDSPHRPVAPPIEREHETYAGIFEEDERRERERR